MLSSALIAACAYTRSFLPARAIYRGLAAETWDALRDGVRRHADHQVAEIERPAADP
ncbi:hypothetical protein [Micromonospora sp. IBSANI012]|uniref:hypothetical protein n=1 Tax=Micromonospora sp. IBSANI012 TaxID=3457761 RepID=UPI004059E37E